MGEQIYIRAWYEPLKKMFYNVFRKPTVQVNDKISFSWFAVDENGETIALEDGCTKIMYGYKDRDITYYEGDVLKIGDRGIRGLVEFKCGAFRLKYIGGVSNYPAGTWDYLIKIGDMYSRPELIKE